MANKVVNDSIYFAYASDNIELELKHELEKYFLYQTILVIDPYFEYGAVTDKLQHSTKCNIIVARKFDSSQNFDNISCVISVNCNFINQIKATCFEKNISYIIALTKLCDSFSFKKYLYNSEFQLISCNNPIGVVFSTDLVFDAKDFIAKVVLEFSTINFINLQSKICNMFFSQTNNLQNDKIFFDLKNIIKNNGDNIKVIVNKVAKLYLSYIIELSTKPINLLDNLMTLYNFNDNIFKKINNTKIFNKKDFLIQIRYIFSLIITCLEKNFFDYYTSKLKDAVNFKVHIDYASQINIKPKLFLSKVPDNKIQFLLSEFRIKFSQNVKEQLDFQNNTKSLIADIDIDFLYKMFHSLKDLPLKYYLSLEQDVFNSKNFLSILYQCGLLNFEI